MKVEAFIAFVINVLETFVPSVPAVTQTLQLLRSIAASPEILAWLEQWLPSRAAGTIGGGGDSPRSMMRGVIPTEVTAKFTPEQVTQLITILSLLVDMWRKYGESNRPVQRDISKSPTGEHEPPQPPQQ